MPQLIRTPEQIFREEGKDIYFIRFKDEKSESPARDEVLKWLSKYLPEVRVESLAPSEHSGFIFGYFGTLRVDFSGSDLAAFCDQWETAEGQSVDPRFQCYLMPYNKWFSKVSRYAPSCERPNSIGLTKWWDTPRGIFYHQISPDQSRTDSLKRHPCLHWDLWFNIVRTIPDLASVDPEGLTYGDILKDENGRWILTYVESYRNTLPDYRKSEILEWFNLPADTQAIDASW